MEKLTCENCGNHYVLKNMDERDKNSGRFCSWKCQVKYLANEWDNDQKKRKREFDSSRTIVS